MTCAIPVSQATSVRSAVSNRISRLKPLLAPSTPFKQRHYGALVQDRHSSTGILRSGVDRVGREYAALVPSPCQLPRKNKRSELHFGHKFSLVSCFGMSQLGGNPAVKREEGRGFLQRPGILGSRGRRVGPEHAARVPTLSVASRKNIRCEPRFGLLFFTRDLLRHITISTNMANVLWV